MSKFKGVCVMFMVVEVSEIVGISPSDFDKPLEKVVLNELKKRYEGAVDEELGYVILVFDAKVDKIGRILPRDGSTYHRSTFKLLTYVPLINEVVLGEVVEITDFGCFVRIGPLDGLIHISQIMDDFITYDEKNNMLIGKKTGRKLLVGDDIRGRINAVSFGGGAGGKVSLVTRQPMMGALKWIEEEIAKTVQSSVG
ncbi:MAG: DNA-directed RNA polymerase [Candidatus Caldarchaeum sp.]|nr:DNA-directed RNA polymerase [Candidatus Caldarchaeum sp.]